MLFITAQAFPEKEDLKGKDNLFDIDVPLNKSLGFKPLWAIPVTTFKETLISMIFTAPNYPQILYLIETEDYTLVDKVKYYQNLSAENNEVPIAKEGTPMHKCEAVIDRQADIELIWASPILSMTPLYTGEAVRGTTVFFKYLEKIPLLDLEYMTKQFELSDMANAEVRALSHACWIPYKYTILPLLLYSLCGDLSAEEMNIDFVSFETTRNAKRMMSLENRFARWSYGDCKESEFDEIYDAISNLIIDNKELLEFFFDGNKVGRNEKCPCGSNIKFKKCHGK